MTHNINARDKIADNLWIGQQPDNFQYPADHFKYIICLTQRPVYQINLYQTVVVSPFEDCNTLPDVDFLDDLAEMTVNFSKKGPTLVHCLAGINRSALICALALIKMGYKPHEAILHLRNTRGREILFNKVFEQHVLSMN